VTGTKEQIQELYRLRRDSSSDEEFLLRAAVSGKFGLRVWTLLRLYMFRKKHPEPVDIGELCAMVAGVIGFSICGAIVGPKNALGGAGIILLSLFVMAPVTLLMAKFESFCAGMDAAEKASK